MVSLLQALMLPACLMAMSGNAKYPTPADACTYGCTRACRAA
jgi:hypothetical protein